VGQIPTVKCVGRCQGGRAGGVQLRGGASLHPFHWGLWEEPKEKKSSRLSKVQVGEAEEAIERRDKKGSSEGGKDG